MYVSQTNPGSTSIDKKRINTDGREKQNFITSFSVSTEPPNWS